MPPEPVDANTLLNDIIVAHREEMVTEGVATSYMAINSGLCEEFAYEVIDRFTEIRPELKEAIYDLCIANLIQIDPATGFSYSEGGPFDRELIAGSFPGIVPPEGMDWDMLDEMSARCGFHAGTHVFTVFDGRFYDAEAPDGVENVFDLPFFKRCIASYSSIPAVTIGACR